MESIESYDLLQNPNYKKAKDRYQVSFNDNETGTTSQLQIPRLNDQRMSLPVLKSKYSNSKKSTSLRSSSYQNADLVKETAYSIDEVKIEPSIN